MTIVTDDFNRADATSLGANWNTYNGQRFQIVGNQATLYAAGGSYNGVSWVANSFTGDQFSEVKIVTLPTTDYAPGPCVRTDSDGIGAGYAVCIRSDGAFRIMREASPVYTSAASQFAAGDTVRLSHASGSTSVIVWKNGTPLYTYTEGGTVLSRTRVGLYAYAFTDGATDWVIDDFRAGDGDGSSGASAVPAIASFYQMLRSA